MKLLLPPDRGKLSAGARAAILAEWMSEWLDENVEVSLASSYKELAGELAAGRAELGWAPPAVCAQVRNHCRAMLTAVRDGRRDYAAALIVRTDSGIGSTEELRGKRASWVDPLSSSGHLLALAHLAEHGIGTADLASQRFAGSFRDALVDVAKNRADVTSTYMIADDAERTHAELRDMLGPLASQLTILERTRPAPFDALTVGFDAPAGLEHRLLELKRRAGAPAMLLEICRADGFVRADPSAFGAFEGFLDRFL